MKDIFDKILSFSINNNLFSKENHIALAVSGGPDSVFMLFFFKEIEKIYKLKLKVIHINHNIRKESTDEEAFVQRLCDKLKVSFISQSVNVLSLAKKHKRNLEEQARLSRYEFFEYIKQKLMLDKIATAHTKNDLVETFLMNLIRGSSLDGLISLKPYRQFYIRPILCSTKEEILDYLHKNNIKYKTDATNFDTHYVRNKIRLELLKILKDYNPNIIDNLGKEIELLYSDYILLYQIALDNFVQAVTVSRNCVKINIDLLSPYRAIQSRVIKIAVYYITKNPYPLSTINFDRILELLNNKEKIIVLRKHIKAYRQSNVLIIEKYEYI